MAGYSGGQCFSIKNLLYQAGWSQPVLREFERGKNFTGAGAPAALSLDHVFARGGETRRDARAHVGPSLRSPGQKCCCCVRDCSHGPAGGHRPGPAGQ